LAEYQDAKYSAALASQKTKSKHEQKLIEEYKAKGYNQHDTEIQAYRRNRTEKVLLAAAGLTVAAVAYNHYKEVTDTILKSGKVYERISADSDKSVKDAFYMIGDKRDKTKYMGLFGADQFDNGKYLKQIRISKDVKVTSPKTAEKILKESMTPEYEKYLHTQFDNQRVFYNAVGMPKAADAFSRAQKDLSSGKVTKNVYEAANILLVDLR